MTLDSFVFSAISIPPNYKFGSSDTTRRSNGTSGLCVCALAGHKIQRKDISARELLEFYLQRVEHYNPRLNAIIFRQDEQARQRADAADAALARGEVWGPLHGVPMTIKEHLRLGRLALDSGESCVSAQLSAA